ncbi:MAG: Rrf2 family transcriptional regulator [Spirochaetes bacterium]|nr:Rrf2 family transcriptional regulator [Spirochaetota bacterium]
MRITSRERYALKALIALADYGDSSPLTSIRTLAGNQRLSPDFLEQVFHKMRQAGIVDSLRGAGGGFRLSRAASEITLLEVLEGAGDPIGFLPCVCENGIRCADPGSCAAGRAWMDMDAMFREYASGRTLAEFVAARKTIS